MPPLVAVNAEYYGWRTALYVAVVMYVSIVSTALLLDASFGALGLVPESVASTDQLAQFKLDYTFWMNVAAVLVVVGQLYLSRNYRREQDDGEMEHDHGGGLGLKRLTAYVFTVVLVGGLVAYFVTGGTG